MVNRESSGLLQAAGYDYKEVGVEFTESDIIEGFLNLIIQTESSPTGTL